MHYTTYGRSPAQDSGDINRESGGILNHNPTPALAPRHRQQGSRGGPAFTYVFNTQLTGGPVEDPSNTNISIIIHIIIISIKVL